MSLNVGKATRDPSSAGRPEFLRAATRPGSRPLLQLEVHGSIASLAAEWGDLAERTGAPPFLRPDWFAAWSRTFAPPALEIVAVRRRGRLVAVVPLARRHRTLRCLTNWHTPRFGVVAEDDRARREAYRAVFKAQPARVSLAFLDHDGPDLADCTSVAEFLGYRVLARTIQRSPYVRIEGDWSAYRRDRSKNAVKGTERRLRRLRELGEVSFELNDGAHDLDACLDEGFAVEGSGWKTKNGTAINSSRETREFYTEVARWAAEHGWLRLAFLRLDGRVIAFEYMLAHEGRMYDLKGGYDPEHGQLSPGIVITYEILAAMFADGCWKSYELGGDDVPFKKQWANGVHELISVQAFEASVSGSARAAFAKYGRPAAKRALLLGRGRSAGSTRLAAAASRLVRSA